MNFAVRHLSRTFLAGLLFAAVHGPEKWALRHSLIK